MFIRFKSYLFNAIKRLHFITSLSGNFLHVLAVTLRHIMSCHVLVRPKMYCQKQPV